MFMRRRVGDDGIGDTAIGHLVLPHFHLHRRHRGHGLDAFHIRLGELFDERQDRIEFAAEAFHLALGDGDPRQMRDATDIFSVDGQGKSRRQSKTAYGGYSRARLASQLWSNRDKDYPAAYRPPSGVAAASAAFSSGIRIASTTALRMEKTSA